MWNLFLLCVAAVVLFYGIRDLLAGAIGRGIALVFLACLIGPGGISLFS